MAFFDVFHIYQIYISSRIRESRLFKLQIIGVSQKNRYLSQ